MTDQDSISLQYTLTPEEVLAGLKRRSSKLRAQAPLPGWITALSWLSLSLLAFSVFQLGDTYDQIDGDAATSLAFFVFLLAAAFVLMLAYWKLATNRIYRHLAIESMHAKGEQHLAVDPQFISLHAGSSSLALNRSQIEAVEVDNSMQLIHIALEGNFYFVVPRRAFPSEAAEQDFIAQLKAKAH